MCERCNTAQATQIHHKTYDRIYNEHLSDLEAVCGPCNMEILLQSAKALKVYLKNEQIGENMGKGD